MTTAAELIALAGIISVEVSKCMSDEELCTLIEFLGLLRHNLEITKHRKIFAKIENKIEEKSDTKEKESRK